MVDEIAKAAAVLGRKGGKITALFGHSYYQELGRKGAAKRWATYKSKLQKDVVQVNKDEVVNVNPA